MNRFTTEPHADGYAIRDAEAGLIRDSKGETLVYADRTLAAYYADAIRRAMTLR